MDFNSILQYLQGLLSNKQTMQGSEFGQNLGLQQQQLAQQGTEFGQQLGLQTQAERDAAANAAGQLALGGTTEADRQALALAQLAQGGSEFGQNLAEQGREFTGNLGLQTQQEKDLAANQAGQLALANLQQNQGNTLATTGQSQQYGLEQEAAQQAAQEQEFQQNQANKNFGLQQQAANAGWLQQMMPFFSRNIGFGPPKSTVGQWVAPQTTPMQNPQNYGGGAAI